MKDLNLALNTFLKLAAMPTPRRIREIQKYAQDKKPYDFYRTLKHIVSKNALNEVSEEEVGNALEIIKKPSEKEHNAAGYKAYLKWKKKLKNAEFKVPKKATFALPNGNVRVKLKPELEYISDGLTHVVQIWNTASPKLTGSTASLGLYLLRLRYPDKNPNIQFHILNLRSGKLISQIQSPNLVEVHLRAELLSIGSIWQQVAT